jgi:hypothetical protein
VLQCIENWRKFRARFVGATCFFERRNERNAEIPHGWCETNRMSKIGERIVGASERAIRITAQHERFRVRSQRKRSRGECDGLIVLAEIVATSRREREHFRIAWIDTKERFDCR